VACARLDSGDIQCIGRDREQQGLSPYGLGRVCDVTKAQKIAMHDKVGCAIVDKGNVRCWIAELQTPQGESCAYPSTEISGIRGATALSIGAGGLCALAGGKVLCWGVPLGWEKLAKPANLPSGIDVMVGIYPCVLGASGQIKCSTKSAAGYKLETKLPAGSKVMLSGFYGCAITPDAKQVCWGSNQGGAMEDGEAIPGPQPVLDNVTALSLAHDASCAVTRDGAIWCRGDALRSGQPRRPEMARRLSRLTIY
jgi:hypothetical protein